MSTGTEENNYTIEVLEMGLGPQPTLFAHLVIVVRDPSGNIMYELNGLATGSDGVPDMIGPPFVVDTIEYYEAQEVSVFANRDAIEHTHPVYSTESLAEVQNLVSRAQVMGSLINSLGIDYSSFDLLSPSENSNSVVNTLLLSMGLSPGESTFANAVPGFGTTLVGPEFLNAITSQNTPTKALDLFDAIIDGFDSALSAGVSDANQFKEYAAAVAQMSEAMADFGLQPTFVQRLDSEGNPELDMAGNPVADYQGYRSLSFAEHQQLNTIHEVVDQLAKVWDFATRLDPAVYDVNGNGIDSAELNAVIAAVDPFNESIGNANTLDFFSDEMGLITGLSRDENDNLVILSTSSDGGNWATTVSSPDATTGEWSVSKDYDYQNGQFILNQTETWGDDADGNPIKQGVEIHDINLGGDALSQTGLASGLTPYLSSAVGLSSDLENLFGGTVIETVLQSFIEITGNTIHHFSFLAPDTDGGVVLEISEATLEDFDTDIATNLTDNAVSLVTQLVMAEIYEVVDVGDGVVGNVADALLTQGVDYFISVGVSNALDVSGIFTTEEAIKFGSPTALIATTLFNEVVPANSTVEGSIANLVSSSFATAFGSSYFASLMPFAGLGPALGPLIVGAAIGAVVDLVVDSIKNPEAYIDLDFDSVAGEFILTNLRDDDGGVREIAQQLGDSAHTYLTQFVDALSSNSNNYALLTPTSVGYKEENYQDGAGVRRDMGSEGASTDTVFGTILEMLGQFQINDGDLKVIKALDLANIATNTAGMTTEEAFSYLYGRMRVAQDYQFYLKNTNAVNAILATAPDSREAAGWLATILQANEMGLADGYNETGDLLDNVFYAADGVDTIDGGDGNDIIKTYAGDDTLIGGAGNDDLEGGAGADSVDGGLGQDRVSFAAATLGVGLDLALGTGSVGDAAGDTYTSIEDVLGSDHADSILGDAGVNVIDGGAGDDFIDGRAGQDQLFGNDGDDFFIWGGGEDTFDGGLGVDTVSLEEIQTSITVQLSETDSPTITFSDGTIYSSFIDIESVRGSSGDDTYIGDGGINWLEGGLGDDFLNGAEGSDTYVYNLGDGNDTISETDWDLTPETDIIKFGENIALGDVSASRDGADLILTITGTGETIRIVDQHVRYSSAETPHLIEEFHFTDGTIVDAEHWRIFDLQSQITSGNETIVGFTFDDTLAGGQGNDRLEGGGGSDIYQINLGDGDDTIREDSPTGVGINNGDDTVKFGAGLLVSDVTLDRIGNDLIFNFAGGDSLTIEDQLGHSWLHVVDYFEFDDGTVWSEDQVSVLLLDAVSTPGDDLVQAYSWSDDTLGGGAGNDRLEGSGGSDTYLFNLGDGNDVIFDGAVTGVSIDNSSDTVLFGAGLEVSNLTLRKQGTDLQFVFISGDTVTIEDTLSHAWLYRVEYYEFNDGTVWTHDDAILASLAPTDGDDVIEAYSTDDALSGGLGNDTLIGFQGSDTYSYFVGDGNLTIDDRDNSSTSIDVLQITGGLVSADLSIEQTQDDLTITLPDGSIISVIDQFRDTANWGLESITFDDGSSLTKAEIAAIATPAFVPSHVGTPGNDLIEGTSGDDGIEGGLGDDIMKGGDGSDIYIFNAGDGVDEIDDDGQADTDELHIKGVAVADVILTRTGGDDLVITFSGSSDQITIWNTLTGWSSDQIERIVFDDGTVWTMDDVRTQLIAQSQTTGNDTIEGFNYDETLEGGLGDDIMKGGDGSDIYIFNAGDGVDEIDDDGQADTDELHIKGVAVADVILTRTGGDDLVITFSGSSDQITIWNTLTGWSSDQIERIVFDDGTVWTMDDVRTQLIAQSQTTGNDTIEGFNYDETLEGGLGDDIMKGGDGSDIYIFNAGDGVDEIDDDGQADTDELHIKGVAVADVILTRTGGDDLVITFSGSSDQITIWNTLTGWSSDQIEQIVFDDGTVWTMDDVRTQLIAQSQTTGNDTIEGFNYDETLEGGLGDDIMKGGDGSDIYIFNAGDGVDEIDDDGWADTDELHIKGVAVADVILTRTGGDDLVITFSGSSDQITIWNTLTGSSSDQIEQIVFDDGTVWDVNEIRNQADSSLPPIIFDMDGDGLYFRDQSISFDFDSDRQIETGAWIDDGDAILALDRNGDGQISSGAEISFVEDLPGALTDLEGLAAFDTNDDGLFSAADDQFSEFMIWSDANADGISQDGELESVADAGLLALSLSSAKFEGVQPNANATIFGETVAVFADGRSVEVADAALDYSEVGLQTLAVNSLDPRIETIAAHFDTIFEQSHGSFGSLNPFGLDWGYQRSYEFVERDSSQVEDLLELWMARDTIELPQANGHILSTVKQTADEFDSEAINFNRQTLVSEWIRDDKIDLDAIDGDGFRTIKLSRDENWYSDGKDSQYAVGSTNTDKEDTDAPIPVQVAPDFVTDNLWVEIA